MRTSCTIWAFLLCPVFTTYLSFSFFNQSSRFHLALTCSGNVADLFPTYPLTTWLWMDRTRHSIRTVTASYQNRKLTLQLQQMTCRSADRAGKLLQVTSKARHTNLLPVSVSRGMTPVLNLYKCGIFKTRININYGHLFCHADFKGLSRSHTDNI